MAMENGLDPYKHLMWLLWKVKDIDLTDAETVQSFLPWNTVTKCLSKQFTPAPRKFSEPELFIRY